MKSPKDCRTIHEIRNEIDNIDIQIITLLGDRYQYVKEIVKFKKTEKDVIAKKRYGQVFEIRRKWAEEKGIDPGVVENIYKILLQYFIEEQRRLLKLE